MRKSVNEARPTWPNGQDLIPTNPIPAGRSFAGIYYTLANDHAEIFSMVDELLLCRAPEEASKLVANIERNLEAHTRAEEEVFYRELLKHDAATIVLQSIREHDEIRNLIEELNRSLSDEYYSLESMVGAAEQLQQCLVDHVDEEENGLFPLAAKLIHVNTARRLDAEYKQKREEYKKKA